MLRNTIFGLILAFALVASTAMVSSAADTVDLNATQSLGHGGGGGGGGGWGGGGGCDPGATPEPATMLLLGSGLLGMVAYKKRMRG